MTREQRRSLWDVVLIAIVVIAAIWVAVSPYLKDWLAGAHQ